VFVGRAVQHRADQFGIVGLKKFHGPDRLTPQSLQNLGLGCTSKQALVFDQGLLNLGIAGHITCIYCPQVQGGFAFGIEKILPSAFHQDPRCLLGKTDSHLFFLT
jgi:hypothetical protein